MANDGVQMLLNSLFHLFICVFSLYTRKWKKKYDGWLIAYRLTFIYHFIQFISLVWRCGKMTDTFGLLWTTINFHKKNQQNEDNWINFVKMWLIIQFHDMFMSKSIYAHNKPSHAYMLILCMEIWHAKCQSTHSPLFVAPFTFFCAAVIGKQICLPTKMLTSQYQQLYRLLETIAKQSAQITEQLHSRAAKTKNWYQQPLQTRRD